MALSPDATAAATVTSALVAMRRLRAAGHEDAAAAVAQLVATFRYQRRLTAALRAAVGPETYRRAELKAARAKS